MEVISCVELTVLENSYGLETLGWQLSVEITVGSVGMCRK